MTDAPDGTRPVIIPSVINPQPVKTDVQRIADALERIAKALEAGR